jgi:hypothetical protein
MNSNEYLFPVRRNRRDFMAMGVLGLAGVAAGGLAASGQDSGVATIGEGSSKFSLDATWGKLPEGMKYGLGCAIVVDKQDRVIVTSRSTSPCVAIFDKDGKLLETWGKDFATGVGYDTTAEVQATAHGLYLSEENGTEYLYWTENVARAKGADGKAGKAYGARVYKTDMQGKVLYTVGMVENESATAQKLDLTNPTDVAVAPNGDIYIVDGYGSQKVHRFSKDFKKLKTIGGPGKSAGLFSTCHGVWVNTLKKEPEVYIADRANQRLEVYSLELEYKRSLAEFRLPCCFYQQGGKLYVPELEARVSVLDENDKVVARLGDGKGISDAEISKHPGKFAKPHALTLDSKGNLFVLEWLPWGRVRKFSPVA